jgi:hypothetical protein
MALTRAQKDKQIQELREQFAVAQSLVVAEKRIAA